MRMGIRVRNMFNLPASKIPKYYLFTRYAVGVTLDIFCEG